MCGDGLDEDFADACPCRRSPSIVGAGLVPAQLRRPIHLIRFATLISCRATQRDQQKDHQCLNSSSLRQGRCRYIMSADLPVHAIFHRLAAPTLLGATPCVLPWISGAVMVT